MEVFEIIVSQKWNVYIFTRSRGRYMHLIVEKLKVTNYIVWGAFKFFTPKKQRCKKQSLGDLQKRPTLTTWLVREKWKINEVIVQSPTKKCSMCISTYYNNYLIFEFKAILKKCFSPSSCKTWSNAYSSLKYLIIKLIKIPNPHQILLL